MFSSPVWRKAGNRSILGRYASVGALGRVGIANALAWDVALATCMATRVEKRRPLPRDTIVPAPTAAARNIRDNIRD